MLGSDYRELIVPKLDNRSKLIAILAAGVALLAVTVVIAIVFGKPLLLLLTPVIAGAAFYLFYTNRIEYEYIISGDQLDITKILSQSRRKPMLTVSLTKFTGFGKLTEAEPVSESQTLVLACSAQDTACYYADFDHEEFGQTRLLLTPNEDILLYFEKHLPRSVGFRYLR